MYSQIFGALTAALVAFIASVYGGYFSFVRHVCNRAMHRTQGKNIRTRVTIIVPTYNDAATIRHKLENIVAQSYPIDLVEVLVIDSNSRDRTRGIVTEFMAGHPEVKARMIVEDERRGKSVAINRALASVGQGCQVVVMTDANAFLGKNALQGLVERFTNAEVGAVVGKQMISQSSSPTARIESNYLSLSHKIRQAESLVDSTPIFAGELSAYRRDLLEGMSLREDLNADDSQLAIMVRRKGYRAVMESKALFYEPYPLNRDSLTRQKTRRGQGLSRLFWYNRDMVFNREYGRFGLVIFPINFFMHVVSPFLVFLTIPLGIASILLYLLEEQNPLMLIVATVIVLSLLVLGTLSDKTRILKIPYIFLNYQLILLRGMILYLRGKSLHKWKKVQRTEPEEFGAPLP